MAVVVQGITHDPLYTISDEMSCKAYGKKRVSNHGLFNEKKKFQEKLFGMSMRSKARSKQYDHYDHYMRLNYLDSVDKG